MKTVIIFDSCGEVDLKFYIVDGDWSILDKFYVNMTEPTEEQQKLMDLLEKESYVKEFPVEAVKEGAKVIVHGYAS